MSKNQQTLLCHYHYDPLDRLADCTVAGQAGVRRFYLKDRLSTEIQGQAQHSVIQHGDHVLAQQQRQQGILETTLLATDQQRSVLQLLNAIQPHPIAYTPYGHRPAENGLLSLLGFYGERPDPVTGHYLLGNGYRAFNPVLMRFNSPDSLSPFGNGGLNAYAYCVGDPVNRSDPTGHFPPFSKLLGLLDDFTQPGTMKSVAPQVTANTIAKETEPGLFKGMIETTMQSVQASKTPQPMSPERLLIKKALGGLENPEPFVKNLLLVNDNLASHGVGGLSKQHAQAYVQLGREVANGQRLNTSAHFEAGLLWSRQYRQDGTAHSAAGAGLNWLATLGAAPGDARNLKTGKWLRQGPS